MLQKYDIKANDAILAEDKHMGIFEDLLQNHNAKLIAGGAAQNSARGAQVGHTPSLPKFFLPVVRYRIIPVSLSPNPFVDAVSDDGSTFSPHHLSSTSAASAPTLMQTRSAPSTTPPVSLPNISSPPKVLRRADVVLSSRATIAPW